MPVDEMRGKIRNPKYSLQVHDFSGLRWGKITPTNIDGFVEFGGRVFVFIETKFAGAELPAGQRLALERLCDAVEDGNKYALAVVAEHECEVGMEIDAAALPVHEIRWRRKWRTKHSFGTLRELVDSFRKFADHDAWIAAYEREQQQAPLSGCNDGTICPRPA